MSENSFAEERSHVDRTAVNQLSAGLAEVSWSAVQQLTADTVNANNSAFGIAKGATLELKQSAAALVTGDYVRVEDSAVFLLLAPRVSGNVKALITVPAALALGAGIVLTRFALSNLKQRAHS
jgi:hypothetical protein